MHNTCVGVGVCMPCHTCTCMYCAAALQTSRGGHHYQGRQRPQKVHQKSVWNRYCYSVVYLSQCCCCCSHDWWAFLSKPVLIVLQVFSPPLYTNEIKAEVNERQVKMRSNLDLFIKNLTVQTSKLASCPLRGDYTWNQRNCNTYL